MEVISIYTDAQAVADGVLIDSSPLGLWLYGRPVNRVTAWLWYEHVKDGSNAVVLARDAFARLIADRLPKATRDGDWIILDPGALWLVPNDVAGWTLLRPDDY